MHKPSFSFLLAAFLLAVVPGRVDAAQSIAWSQSSQDIARGNGMPGCGLTPYAQKSQVLDGIGDVIVVGAASNGRSRDMSINKFDSATGTALWGASYGGTANQTDCAYAVAVNAANDVFVTGYTVDTLGGENIRTIKYDGDTGAVLWNVQYNGSANSDDRGFAIAVDSAGNVVVAGNSSDTGEGRNIRVLKYNGMDGTLLWNAARNGPASLNDNTRGLALDANNDVFVVGTIFESATISRFTTAKLLGLNGNLVWQSAIAPGEASAIVIDGAGNPVITGSFNNAGAVDFYTTRLNSTTGAPFWATTFDGGFGADNALAVAVDAASHVIVTGFSFDGAQGGSNIRTVQYNLANGTRTWTVAFAGSNGGTDVGNAVAVDSANDVFVTGFADEGGSASNDIRTIKLNGGTGATTWTTRYSGSGNFADTGFAASVTSAGSVIVSGASYDTPDGFAIRTIRYNGGSGSVMWNTQNPPIAYPTTVAGSPFSQRTSAVDAAGNLVTVGYSVEPGHGANMLVIKQSRATGAELWRKSFNGSADADDVAHAVALDSAGNVFVTGTSSEAGEGGNIRTLKFGSASGTLLWSADFNGSSNGFDIAFQAAVDTAGNVIVVGYSNETGQGNNLRTIKYRGTDGVQLWSSAYNGSAANSDDQGYRVAVDANGDVVMTGISTDVGQGFNMRTIKYLGTTGAEVWNSVYNGTSNGSDFSYALALDAAGDVVVAGSTRDGTGPQPSNQRQQARTIKLHGDTGALDWTRAYAGDASGSDFNYDVAVDANGDVAVAGYSSRATFGESMRVWKYVGLTGFPLWNASYDGAGSGNDRAQSVAFDEAGHVLILGYSTDVAGGRNLRIVKFEAETGTFIWTFAHSGSANSSDEGYSLVSRPGEVYLSGFSVETGFPVGLRTMKINDGYVVSLNAGPNGSITPVVAPRANYGDVLTFTVTPNTGYTPAVSGTCGGSLVGTTFTSAPITADCSIDATFSIIRLDVTPSAGRGGSITPDTVQQVDYGTTTSFTVTPDNTNTAVVGGTCGGTLVGTTYTTAAVTQNCSVEAQFLPPRYTVTPSAGANGTIAPSIAQFIFEGDTTTFSVTPDTGYTAVIGGTCGGTLVGTTFTTSPVVADCTVAATFVSNLPDAPVLTAAVGISQGATLTFTPPSGTGGNPVLDYAVTCNPGNITTSVPGSPVTIGGLTNNVTYRCFVTARTIAGRSVPSNERSVIPTEGGTSADLSITKTNGKTFVDDGQPVTYSITVHNAGPAGAPGARVQDVLGSEFSDATWSCTGDTPLSCSVDNGSGDLDVLIDLPANSSAQIEFTATPVLGSTTPLSNVASIAAPNGISDPTSANNVASDGPDIRGLFRDGFE